MQRKVAVPTTLNIVVESSVDKDLAAVDKTKQVLKGTFKRENSVLSKDELQDLIASKTTQQLRKSLSKLLWEEKLIEDQQNAKYTSKAPAEKYFLGDFFFRKGFL